MAGKGTLQKRGPNSWKLTAACGLDAEKKQIRKTKTITVEQTCELKSCKGCPKMKRCKARGEAEKQLALFVDEIEKGTFIEPTKLTLADFVERWLRDYGETNLAPKTLHRYKGILTRVLQAMGHIKIEKIRPTHLLEFYANLQEDGIREDGKEGKLSEKTILYHHRVISSILNDAVQWQVIPFNPASRVKPPKVPKHQATCYDEEKVAALLTALEEENFKYRVIVTLAIATGLRRGELMGLEWQDIDFDKSTLEVRQASQYLPGKGTFTKEPKNETSKRIISVPASVVALLKQYKVYQAQERLKVGELWQGSERLFTTWDGRPMHPDTISKWFPKFLAKTIIHKPCNKVIGNVTHCPHCEKPVKKEELIKLPPLPFHGLRHTSATLLVGQGIHAKVISERLGHSNISTTMNIYSHFIRRADVEAADKLEELFTTKVDQK
ncbi:Transposase [Sporotomaculum syntrophicum]|uniref:Transposase n=1 Tax=Sporotomaculum syntrophicum TaxID=182264 RepID=A0A9D3AWJ7_9FIRM|nr:site-specific integrase [Sporotomaculum syntrophicum]KAF1083877.1 Transposase [Sporotomaculum syntrophicum]